jgi:peptidoglycan/LPS O-acetylase OafA/YrhL
MHTHDSYRPDIDGLRFIAVVSVVIFHSFPSVLTGGFIGVDIFFVISGYLITGIIFKEQINNSFSLSHFYAKRIKRIFPALLIVLIFSLVVGWVALTADEYKQLTRHAAAGAAFINNVVSWRESGYFDNPAETKPLLHLWSLAIEEQFYLFWPLIFITLVKFRRFVFAPIAVLLAASFVYSAWKIQIDPVGDFYSPLTRFWELLAGGLLASISMTHPKLLQKHHDFISLIGVASITIGFFLIDKKSAFPGTLALFPVVGAALLIWSRNSIFNQKLLASPLFVSIGLISYPLYLWHWPLLSFARIFEGGTPSSAQRLALVGTSFLLAWLTYQLIEKPIRGKKDNQVIVTVLSAAMIAVLVTAFYIKTNHGFAFRQFGKLNGNPATLVIGEDRSSHSRICGLEEIKTIDIEWCAQDNKLSQPNYAVLGDSKGEALYFGLSRQSSAKESWMMIGPVNFLTGYSDGLNQLAMDKITSDKNIKTVVLSNALRGFTSLNQTTGFIDYQVPSEKISTWVKAYSSAIQHLQGAGKKVVFVMDNPTLPDPNSCLSGDMTPFAILNIFIHRNANQNCHVSYSDHLKGTAPYREFIQQLQAQNPELLIFDPTPLLCDLNTNTCSISEGDSFLYSYGDHISDYASSKVATQLLPMLRK